MKIDKATILSEFRTNGAEELLPMVSRCQATLLYEDDGKILGVMSACLVNATEDAAWNVILDYDSYHRFMSGINVSQVISRNDNEYVVKFEAGLKIMGVGAIVKYTYRLVVEKPYANVFNAANGKPIGYWAVFPAGDPGQVVIVHADVAKDIKNINNFVRFLIQTMPTAEIGLHISPVVMMVNRMKKRIEQVHAG